MAKDYATMAHGIIESSGGDDNFLTVTNCATRVRITYRDLSRVQIEDIKKLDGVLSVIVNDAVQIVVGPGVCGKVTELIQKELESRGVYAPADDSVAAQTTGAKKSNVLRLFSDIFVPTLPAMIAAGILRGVDNIMGTIAATQAAANGIVATETLSAADIWLQNIHLLGLSNMIDVIYAAVFSYLAVYVGFTCAKQFKVSPVLGAVIGCITLQSGVKALGASAGQGGLIGVIIGVYALSWIEKIVKKVVPNAVDTVFTPTLSVLITATLMVKIFMPICGVLSTVIVNGLMWLLDTTGAFGGFVLSTLAPSLISTGLHHGLTAIHMEMLNTLGNAPLLACQVMSNAGMVGASCAIFVMSKNPKVKEACKGAIPTSFLCVGEPVIYGVCLPSGFGFITGSIGAGVGGFFIRLFGVSFSAMGMAGMSAVPLVADNKYIYYLISYFAAAAAAFVLTYIVGKARHYE